MIQHLYSNIPDSGITADDEMKDGDIKWNTNGYLRKFDQRPLITNALARFVHQGGSVNIPHKITDTGYFYYPKNCVVNDNKCKFMIVSHPEGGFKDAFVNTFGQFASANDIVMVWPTVTDKWDDSGYTGDTYNTKWSI